MGLKDAAIPGVLFCVAIFGIAQSAITINAYLTTNKPKDASFNFSVVVMVFSICMLFGGGYFIYKAFAGAAGGGEAAEVAGAGASPRAQAASWRPASALTSLSSGRNARC